MQGIRDENHCQLKLSGMGDGDLAGLYNISFMFSVTSMLLLQRYIFCRNYFLVNLMTWINDIINMFQVSTAADTCARKVCSHLCARHQCD